jgi:tetratricopeptide (TPR) repeat protein
MTMDGRWKVGVAGGLILSGVIGCTTTKPSSVIPEPPPVTAGKNSVYIPDAADDSDKKEGPLACSTLILVANIWVEDVAKNPNKPAADRDRVLNRARMVYQEVLQREPKNVDALLALGQLYLVSGEADKVREIESKAASMHAQNPKVWAWLAVRQAQSKNWEAAAESYQRAVKLDPENRTYRIHLGFTLARTGRYSEGFEWLSRSMREAEARYNLAQMMLHNGDEEKARMELRLALKADPNFKIASDQLAYLQNGSHRSGSDVRTVGHSESIPPIQVDGR